MQTFENGFVSVCVRNCTFPLSSLKFCLVGHRLRECIYLVSVDAGQKHSDSFQKINTYVRFRNHSVVRFEMMICENIEVG